MSYINTVDLSSWNGNINFQNLINHGVKAVILRVGFGNDISQKDSKFEEYYTNAKRYGLLVGGYWYSYANSVSDSIKEAETCLKCLNGKTLDLPLFYDMEETEQTNFGKKLLTEMAYNFCTTIKNNSYSAGIYSNINWFTNYLDYDYLKTKFYIWLAQWNYKNDLECDVWQYSENGKINNESCNFDFNFILNSSIINDKRNNKMEYGYTNTAILTLKQHLKILYNLGVISTKVDNSAGFGDGTLNAVKELQKVAKITVDGIVGTETINAIYNLINTAISNNVSKIESIKRIVG